MVSKWIYKYCLMHELSCRLNLECIDSCDRQIIFEFKLEVVKAGNTLQIRIVLNLNVKNNYGSVGAELKQFS